MKEWLAAANITEGALFCRVSKGGNLLPGRLTSQSVAVIVKAYAARLTLDPDVFSGHSLRSGFLTSAVARDALLFKRSMSAGFAATSATLTRSAPLPKTNLHRSCRQAQPNGF
jgi:hypothetical protein